MVNVIPLLQPPIYSTLLQFLIGDRKQERYCSNVLSMVVREKRELEKEYQRGREKLL